MPVERMATCSTKWQTHCANVVHEGSKLERSVHEARTTRGCIGLPVHPATALKARGLTTRQRGNEKVDAAVEWLANFTWTTEAIMLRRLGIQTRGYMRSLERKGLLRPIVANIRGGHLWALTDRGLQFAQAACSKEFDYPKRPERLSQATLRHDLAVQDIVAQTVSSGLVRRFEGPSKPSRPTQWAPDAWLWEATRTVGLELERTSKGERELRIKLTNITTELNLAHQEGGRGLVRWVSHRDSVRRFRDMMVRGFDRMVYDDDLGWREPYGHELRELGLLDPSAVEFVKLDCDPALTF